MENKNKIKCPHCTREFSVEEALSGDIEKHIREKYLAALQKEKDAFADKEKALNQQKQLLEKQREEQDRKLQEAIASEKLKLKSEAEKKAKEELEELLRALREENEDKAKKLREAQRKELEILKKEKELLERQETLELELRKSMLEKENEIAEKVRKLETDKNELKFREYEKKLEDQMKLVEEMKRKAEQGSMQLQGEVQELAIEEFLRSSFPLDLVTEIRKGQRGADCTQHVLNNRGEECGIIYYESKRTKDFQPSWIPKFKEDMRDQHADIGILVTEAMPKGMSCFGQLEGIWICTFSEFKALCYVMRDTLLRIRDRMVAQENQGDKMQLLYQYLTGNEFRSSVEAIVEGFTALQEGLQKERNAMERIWKEREKQIEKVIRNTIGMYGSVKGIAGGAIQEIKQLGLPDGE
jgi:hypothetical protein